MKNLIEPLNLSDFPKIDEVTYKDKIIEGKKIINKLIKKSKSKARPDKCFYCKTICNSFCNSHTVPAFCLRNIAQNGEVFYSNTLVKLSLLKEKNGINEAGIFHLICRDCDSKIFQNYENPDNYENIPSSKMLSEIDMKNNLKNISKRLTEQEMNSILYQDWKINEDFYEKQKHVKDLDLREFTAAFDRAKRSTAKPSESDYYLGFYQKLPYVVPVAFQGTIALLSDIEGKVVNNLYIQNPQYKIKYMSLCIFPLKSSSSIFIFVEKGNKKYTQFFKQLKKLDTLENQLSVINYILFSYSEDYFLSKKLSNDTLDRLVDIAGKTTNFPANEPFEPAIVVKEAQKIYNIEERKKIPNLLSKKFAL